MSGLVIGIDTSTDVRVGVARDGRVVATRRVDDTRQHVERLVGLLRDAVDEAGSLIELERVCVGLGPGPFTGLRVGITAAQVLATVRGVPLHGVCSLDVMAKQHAAARRSLGGLGSVAERSPSERQRDEEFVVASDARRKELYWARYAGGVRVEEPHVSAPEALPDLPVVGPGAAVYAEVLGDRAVTGTDGVDAGLMAALGVELPDAGTEPLYLRSPDAVEPTRRKSTLVRPPVRGRRPRG